MLGNFLDLKNIQLPIPVDPERPEEGERLVNASLAITKLWEIANHLQVISESTKQLETRETNSWRTAVVNFSAGSNTQRFEFEPVPQGAVHHITHMSMKCVLPIADLARYSVQATWNRNTQGADTYVTYMTTPSLTYVNFAAPIILQQGERIVGEVLRSFDPPPDFPVYMNIGYREYLIGPQFVQA